MLPINVGGHPAYQKQLISQLRKYYPDYSSIPAEYSNIIDQFWHFDLSDTDIITRDCYSKFGPEPRLPSCMLRSFLLSIKLKITSIEHWVAQMRVNPLFAILSGFQYGDTPGATTFYDFFDRLWLSDHDNFNPHLQTRTTKVKKPPKSGAKAPPTEKISVEELMLKLEANPPDAIQPYAYLTQLFKKQSLDVSVLKGLIRSHELSLAGDGTPIYTSARSRNHRRCSCKDQSINGCSCPRYYPQPDCDKGWDSSRKCFYYGYDLYMFVDADSESDLPIFPLLAPASRHDSHGFVHTWFTMHQMMPELSVKKLLLDAAHDAMPIYEYCRKNHITPFIDLNNKGNVKLPYKNDFTIGTDGIPICRAGRKMNRDGVEKAKYRAKFRCPLTNRKYGCSCSNPCSDSKHGRTVHLATKDNPRIINIPPRESKEWKVEYNARTSAERSNKRQKNDYLLESGKHRSSKMWYCRLYATMMLQHLDAWDLPYKSEIAFQLQQV